MACTIGNQIHYGLPGKCDTFMRREKQKMVVEHFDARRPAIYS